VASQQLGFQEMADRRWKWQGIGIRRLGTLVPGVARSEVRSECKNKNKGHAADVSMFHQISVRGMGWTPPSADHQRSLEHKYRGDR
jgi:hypothetical protein